MAPTDPPTPGRTAAPAPPAAGLPRSALAMPAAPALAQGRFEGREAFRQLLRQALAAAAQQGWSELMLSDADFADWPLGEREVVQSLTQWAAPRRRITLLAADYGELVRRQPRFVQWRRQWDHLIVCRRGAPGDPPALPSALWSPRWSLQRQDPVRSIGHSGPEPERCAVLHETLREWLERRSTPAFPATVLGL